LNLQEAYNQLNFWINKKTGAWYSPEELDAITDRGQISLFSDIQPQYATSQHVKDALAPFRRVWPFGPSETVSGVIPIPSNLNYLNLLSITVSYTISDRTTYAPVTMVNEDEIANRLNSQIDPVTVTSPIGEQLSPGFFRLYPSSGYTGNIVFFRRPAKPAFVYTTISERVVVYDDAASTQLEWPENWQNAVLLKALISAGINLTDQEIQQFSEMKTNQNFQGVNRT
jgi:hypothetical protein